MNIPFLNDVTVTGIVSTNKGTSNDWSIAYTNLVSNSASYILSGTEVYLGNIPAVSGNWTEAYTNLVSNSSAYLSGFDSSLLTTTSGNWDSTNTTVQSNSTLWTPQNIQTLRFFNKSSPVFDSIFSALYRPKIYTAIPPQTLFIVNYNNQDITLIPSSTGIWINVPTNDSLNIPDPQVTGYYNVPTLYPPLSTLQSFNILPTEIDCNLEGVIGGSIVITQSYAITGIKFNELIYAPSIILNTQSNRVSSVSFPKLKYINIGTGYIQMGGIGQPAMFEHVEAVEFPELELGGGFVFGGYIVSTNNSSPGVGKFRVRDIKFPKAKILHSIDVGVYSFAAALPTGVVGLSTTYPFLTSLEFPSLEMITGSCTFSLLRSLSVLSFPELKILSSTINIDRCENLKELNFPKLKYIAAGYLLNLSFDSSTTNTSFFPRITSISLPELEAVLPGASFPGIRLGSVPFPLIDTFGRPFLNKNVKKINFGNNKLKYFQTSFTCNQELDVESVDNTLKTFARLSGSDGFEYYPLAGYASSISLGGYNAAPTFNQGLSSLIGGYYNDIWPWPTTPVEWRKAFTTTNGVTITATASAHGVNKGDYVTFLRADNSTSDPFNGTYVVTNYINLTSFEFTLRTPISNPYLWSSENRYRFLRTPDNKENGFYNYQLLASRLFVSVTINLPVSTV